MIRNCKYCNTPFSTLRGGRKYCDSCLTTETRICKCGCGLTFECKHHENKLFYVGHNGRVLKHSQETKDKISSGNTGKVRDQDTRDRISKTVTEGYTPERRKEISLKQTEFIANNRELLKEKVWNGEKVQKKRSKSLTEYYNTSEGKEKQSIRSKVAKPGTSKTLRRKFYNWSLGVPFEVNIDYPLEFNDKLRKSIKQRDNYTCQECKMLEVELKYKLHIHHIDYNKKNNNPSNLISLCRSCHGQTNFKRNDWTQYFQDKLTI